MKLTTGLAFAVSLVAGLAQVPAQVSHTAAEMEPILDRIAKYEYGQSPDPLFQLTMLVQDSMRSAALARRTEARLLRFLQSDATMAGKQAVSEQLSLIATEASVPVLSAMLKHPETAEMARYALARIPGPKADEALRKALDGTSGGVRIGVINSLGQRRDSQAAPRLGSLLSSPDPGVAAAAIGALGDIASRQALDELGAARGKVPGPLRPRVLDAYLRCAGRLAQAGDRGSDRNAALTAYRRVLAETAPPMIRVAALTGLAGLEGQNSLPALTAEIGAHDPPVRDAAIRLIARIPGRESTVALMDRFASLPPSGQVRLLAALAEHGDATARLLLIEAAKGNSPEVRTAALAGLGRLGDESSVGILGEAAASGQAPEQAAARQSLSALAGPGVDSAVVAAIGASSGKIKAELILAAGERGGTSAADALIQAVHDPDPDVRRNALRALRNIAGPAQVPALIEMVIKGDAADLRDATQALAAALKRSPPAEINQVIQAYQAAAALAPRLALIDAMGQVSSREALPLLRAGLQDSSPEIARAAILALTGWADPAPIPDLLAAAKTNADPALEVLSLRGCLKLIALPSQRPIEESARLLAEVMALAQQPAEKKSVLALLPAYPCEEALRVAEDCLHDPALANEAKASVERIRNSRR